MTPKKWARDLHAENFEGIKGMKIFHFVFKQVSNLTPKPKPKKAMVGLGSDWVSNLDW